MSDDISSNLQIVGWVIMGVTSFFWTMTCLVFMGVHEYKTPKWRTFLWLKFLAIPLLAWLWFPWVGYGIYRVARWSTNGIDYCERPPTVIPAKPEVIDLNKHAEKP